MNILRLTPSGKSGITYYSLIFDKILKQQDVRIIKAKYFSNNSSTWWLLFDFLFRNYYWESILNNIDAVHAEVGIHQAREILSLYYLKMIRNDLKIFVTIHDPGISSYRIFKIYCNTSGSLIAKIINKITDKIEPIIDSIFFKRVIDYILEQSSALFVFNRWGAEQLSVKYPNIKGKIKIINHPVYDFPKQKIKQITGRKLVFAGFWSENKGIEILIRAYYLLKKRQITELPNLILAGETQIPNSSYSRKIKKLVEILGLNGSVSFPGFLKEDRMFEILSEAFLVIPYTNKISGSASGIHIMGLQAGAVTIVGDNPTLSSFVKGNRVSLIFKQGMVEDLSDKIREVVQNQGLAYRLAKNGQNLVYRYGDWKKLGRSIIKIYKSSFTQ